MGESKDEEDTEHMRRRGTIVTVNMELAVITPPVGMNLYAISAITRIPTAEVLRGTVPFMLIIFTALLLFTYVPSLSTFTLDLARMLK